jgi:hypothetical protein
VKALPKYVLAVKLRSPLEEAAKNRAMWGTFGEGGVEHCGGSCPEHQLRWKRLVDCDTGHLQAILRTQAQIIGHRYEGYIRSILADRGVKPDEFSPDAAFELNRKFMKAVRTVSA